MKPLSLSGVQFKLGLREVTGVIQAGLGFPVLYCAETDTVSVIDRPLSSDYLGAQVQVTLRSHSNEIVYEPTLDEKLTNSLGEDEIDVTDPNEQQFLRDALEEQKISLVPRLSYPIVMSLIALVGCIAIALLKHWLLLVVPLSILLVSIVDIINLTKLLSQTRIYDAVGNWVDLETGATSLSNGYIIKPEEEGTIL